MWKTLKPLDDFLEEPNANTEYHVPTPNIPTRSLTGNECGVRKRNYGEKFDRPPFVGSIDVDQHDWFKRKKLTQSQRKQ